MWYFIFHSQVQERSVTPAQTRETALTRDNRVMWEASPGSASKAVTFSLKFCVYFLFVFVWISLRGWRERVFIAAISEIKRSCNIIRGFIKNKIKRHISTFIQCSAWYGLYSNPSCCFISLLLLGDGRCSWSLVIYMFVNHNKCDVGIANRSWSQDQRAGLGENSDRQKPGLESLSLAKPRRRGRENLGLGAMATALPESSRVCVCGLKSRHCGRGALLRFDFVQAVKWMQE